MLIQARRRNPQCHQKQVQKELPREQVVAPGKFYTHQINVLREDVSMGSTRRRVTNMLEFIRNFMLMSSLATRTDQKKFTFVPDS